MTDAKLRERGASNAPLQGVSEESSADHTKVVDESSIVDSDEGLPDWQHLYSPEVLEKSKSTTMPFIAAILSLILPPIGCVVFCMSIRYPAYSERRRMATIALYIGSLLSFIYVLIACVLIGAADVPNDPHVTLGFGY